MRLHRIFLILILSALLAWLGTFLFFQYKTDAFIEKFSPDEVQLSYKTLYVLPGFKHPLTIIIKNMKASVSNGVVFNTDMHLYPGFSSMTAEMDLSVNYRDDHFIIPMIVTTKKSANKNFYLDTFQINNAQSTINGSKITANGGIEFYQDTLPLGGYDISISDTQKLLESDLVGQYPKILYKLEKIFSRIEGRSPKLRLDYTETGMKLDGIPVENL
jgi:hypothetical protein